MADNVATGGLKERIGQTVALMEQAGHAVPAGTLVRFNEALAGLGGWDSFRINPVAFAAAAGLDLDEALGLFVYGAKSGLFGFEWNLLCPYCGGREHSHATLDHMEKDSYHCTLCDADLEVVADDHLEVSFTLNPELSGFRPDPLKSRTDYFACHFSRNFRRHPEVQAVIDRLPPLRYVTVPPGASARVRLGPVAGRRHRVLSFDSHSIYNVFMDPTAAATGPARLEVEHGPKGFARKSDTVPQGDAELVVRNRGGAAFGLIVAAPDTEAMSRVLAGNANSFAPFVTGKHMLNNQYFRELFLVDNLPDDLSLKLNDITLMFTDLKGSTALYEKTGDVRAYRLVKEHFAMLSRIVREHRGAIVKTMGDAIMASFNDPVAGLRAASAMLGEIAGFNQAKGDELLGLKIGLHRGPVIAVKANQTLDYFGQTVNIAARIQGLAESGEIWLSDDALRDAAAAARGLRVESRQVSLKGVSDQLAVHRAVAV
jgi:class 3 adenylate cyclase